MAAPNEARSKAWPGSRGHWLLGCLRQLQSDPLTLYRSAWQHHGDYVRLRLLPGIHFFMLVHPEAIEHVLYKNHKNYRKPDVLTRPMSLLTGNGIFTSEGDFWLRQRRLMQPAFARQQLVRISSCMVQSVEQFLHEWAQAESGRRLDVAPEMMRLALRIASTSLFGADISTEADKVGRAYRIAFEYVSFKMNRIMAPMWFPTKRNREFRDSKTLLDKVVLELIESRRRSPTAANDLLDLLLTAQDDESGAGMSDQQLKDEVVTLLTAGHETVGAALSWSWYLLSQHQDVQQALHDEVRSRLQGRTPAMDDLQHLPLATAVFDETMRLYPPAWGLPREAIHDDEINGYPVPKKAIFTLAQFLTHRHPAFWQEPERFNPERFLSNQSRPKCAYFPFGGGPRVCIGNQFAMIEGPLVLAALAQQFHFTPTPDQTVVPDATFTLRPKTGVKVMVRKR